MIFRDYSETVGRCSNEMINVWCHSELYMTVCVTLPHKNPQTRIKLFAVVIGTSVSMRIHYVQDGPKKRTLKKQYGCPLFWTILYMHA